MSGFAAVFHLDGAPVDRAWLEKMADYLGFRGPDSREVWASGSAGMCHALLRTSVRSDGAAQIVHRNGRWLVGNVRIDDRDALASQLSSASYNPQNASSAELILLAYETWGEACLEHLLGDFSFVIWDARRQRVFAARDHLGVRPLFYAQVGQCLLISNTLDCIRQIPIVSEEWNERAIGDWLLVGQNRHPSSTFFAAIQRLPGAHRLVAEGDGLRVDRYWSLPIDEPVYYRRSEDYLERFNELLRAAVRDRLPDGELGVCMSGGLDSPLLAATALDLGASVRAFTAVWDRVIRDPERHFAGLVAAHLRIPICYFALDADPWGWAPGADPIHTPEPVENPLNLAAERRHFSMASTQARVFFWGDGPDGALLYEWQRHFIYLMQRRKWGRLCRDLALHARLFKRVPLLFSVPKIWRARRERRGKTQNHYVPSFPAWINFEFSSRTGLRDRWEKLHEQKSSTHPVRRFGYANFACDFPMDWNTGNGGCPGDPAIDQVHPFWDIRLLRFLLSVPVLPWCRDKFLIRSALRGRLPDEVRSRPKSPVRGVPHLVRARETPSPVLPPVRELEEYVDLRKAPGWPGRTPEETEHELRILGLRCWMAGIDRYNNLDSATPSGIAISDSLA